MFMSIYTNMQYENNVYNNKVCCVCFRAEECLYSHHHQGWLLTATHTDLPGTGGDTVIRCCLYSTVIELVLAAVSWHMCII